MKKLNVAIGAWVCFCLTALTPIHAQDACDGEFTEDFLFEQCVFADHTASFAQQNPYFILEPGWWIALEGEEEEDGEVEFIRLEITVLQETRMVNGILTRVIEEREWIDGELYEVSLNYYAICLTTNDVFYFGEEVDFYEDGEIVNHQGAWLAGENGAQPGVIMPGSILIGSRYMQEIAEEDEALDRGEILDIIDVELAGRSFENVAVIADSSALEPEAEPEIKYFAPYVGQIKDGPLEVVDYGWAFRAPTRWMPHVTRFDGGFETEVRLVNDGEADALMTLFPYLADGSALDTLDLMVPAESTLAIDSTELFGEAEVSHFGIVGPDDCLVVSAYKAAEGPAASAEVRESGSQCAIKVFQGEWSAVFDGIALVNLGPEAATVTATQVDEDGEDLGEEELSTGLAPHAKLLAVFGDVFADQPGSLIEVESDQPFAIVALRGTAPGAALGVLWSNTPILTEHCNEEFEVVEPTMQLEEVKMLIEHNAADEDTGFQCFADGDPWVDLEIAGPGGEIFSISAEGGLDGFGLTELFFETNEPENAEMSIADVLALMPEGTYSVTAIMADGSQSSVSTEFTHTIPAGTEVLSPEDGAENVDPAEVVIAWNPVTQTIDGSTSITMVGYQVVVEAEEEAANPEGFARAKFSVHVPASTTSVSIPEAFMESGKKYKVEILGIEISGNQTISASEFFTGPAFEVEEPEEEEDAMKDLKVLIEHNATDEDTGFQGFADGDPWNELDLSGPGGTIVDASAEGSLVDFGLTELFFETSEPENAEVPIADVLARLAEGTFTVTGDMVDADESEFSTVFSHLIPAGPELLTPVDGDEDVDPEETVISWNAVTESIDGDAVTIVGYQVIVEEDEDPEFPLSFARPVFSVYVPASVTSVQVPQEFMRLDTDYEYEVLAIEASGNQTLSSAEFATEEP